MMKKPVVVTLDGPSGSGKSSVAAFLAERCGYRYLDTGAMYRAVALAALRSGLKTDGIDEGTISLLLDTIDFGLDEKGCVLLDGKRVDREIRDDDVTRTVSAVAALEVVRERMVALQRAFARRGDLVAEGRDLGTVVFPDADHRFYLDADPVVRARRRTLQERGEGRDGKEKDSLEAMRERDRKDSERALSPLAICPGMVEIDTSEMSLDEVVSLIFEKIRRGADGSGL
jgi:CMP/dCMP kinase